MAHGVHHREGVPGDGQGPDRVLDLGLHLWRDVFRAVTSESTDAPSEKGHVSNENVTDALG